MVPGEIHEAFLQACTCLPSDLRLGDPPHPTHLHRRPEIQWLPGGGDRGSQVSEVSYPVSLGAL